jgi:hypothetical protein
MRKTLFIILTCLLTSCSISYIQIFKLGSSNTKLENNFYVFENDTIKLTYSFWKEKGILAFSVFNKLDKPIYVDWKKSSFILNSNKFDYYIDETQTTSLAYYGGYYYNGPMVIPGLTVNEGVTGGIATTFKPEHITFIPPKSNYSRSQFYLMPTGRFVLSKNAKAKVEQRNDNPKKTTTVFQDDFSYETSPIKFRNYIAITMNENSQECSFIDNEFYVSSIREMDIRHFHGKLLPGGISGFPDTYNFEKPEKAPIAFYLYSTQY